MFRILLCAQCGAPTVDEKLTGRYGLTSRRLLFTNEEHLSAAQHQVLDELLREHQDSIVEQTIVFR